MRKEAEEIEEGATMCMWRLWAIPIAESTTLLNAITGSKLEGGLTGRESLKIMKGIRNMKANSWWIRPGIYSPGHPIQLRKR